MNWNNLGKIIGQAVMLGTHVAESISAASGKNAKIEAAVAAANEILSAGGLDAVVIADKKVMAARAVFMEAYVALQNAVAEVKGKTKG